MSFIVLYDACVLYPAPLRDLLIELAVCDMFQAKWTEKIQDEWVGSLLKDRPDLAKVLPRTCKMMNDAVPDCLVENYEPLVPAITLPDPDDRHVLAAAIQSSAQIIVTSNLKDFPSRVLDGFYIAAQHPDNFILTQMELHEGTVIACAKRIRARLGKPAMNVTEYLAKLAAVGLVVTAERLKEFEELL